MGNRIASFILGGAAAAMAFLGWWVIYRYLQDSSTVWTPALIFFGLYLVGLLILVIISIRFASFAFVVSLAPAFLLGTNILFFGVLAGALAIFYLGALRIKKFKRNSIELRLTQIIPVGYSLITTAICVVLAASYFFSLDEKRDAKTEEISIRAAVPMSVTNFIFNLGEKVAGSRLGGTSPDQSVNDFIEALLTKEAQRQGADSVAVNEAMIQKQIELWSREWGVSISGEEKMEQFFNNIVNKQIDLRLRSSDQQEGTVSPFLLAVGLFLTLKAVGWFLRLPLILAATIIFKLLTRLGVLNLKRKQVLAERV